MITVGRYINSTIKNTHKTEFSFWNYVSTTMAAVNESYGDCNITLEAMAESFHISKSYLNRIFKQFMCESFSNYLCKRRLESACSLLINTYMTVNEIMKKCEMRDATSFYKSFGEHTGTTPNKYRKNKHKRRKQNEHSY